MLAVPGTALTALAVTAALSGAAVAGSHPAVPAHQVSNSVTRAAGGRMALFRAAAKEFGVPASILLAIGYNESRWEPHGAMPSADGGYGLMNLTARTFTVANAQGKGGRQTRTVSLVKTHYTVPRRPACYMSRPAS